MKNPLHTLLLLFIFFSTTISISAQDDAISEKDEALLEKILELVELTEQSFQSEDYAEALRLSNNALDLYEQVKEKDEQVYAFLINKIAVNQFNLGNFTEAIEFGTKSLDIYENMEDYPNYVVALGNLALYNSSLGNYDEAVRLESKSSELQENTSDRDNLTYANTLNNLAIYNSHLCNYANAIKFGTEALSLFESTQGKLNIDYATALCNLAYYNANLGYYKEAVRLEKESLDIKEKIYGKNHREYAISLSNIAENLWKLGNYSEAITLCTDALEVESEISGSETVEYAALLNNLANYNSASGDYEEALRLGTDALIIKRRILGRNHPDYATSLNNLATYYSYVGNYTEAVNLVNEALDIQEKISGKESQDYATLLINLASYNSEIGNLDESIRLNKVALVIREKQLGKNHPDYATVLSHIASCLSDMGNCAEAMRIETEALNIREQILGKNHPDYVISLNNLALYNSNYGNYAESVRLGLQALSIQEKFYGKNNRVYASLLQNISNYYHDIENNIEAFRLASEAMKIRETLLGKTHPDYANSLRSLALCHSEIGDYGEAIRLLNEALDIQEKLFGKNHNEYAMTLASLANIHTKLGNYEEAIKLISEALNIQGNIFGENSLFYSNTLCQLSNYSFYSGNYKNAVLFGEKALNIQERILGKNSEDYITSLRNLCNHHIFNNSIELNGLENYISEINQLTSSYIRNQFSSLTSTERNSFWNKTIIKQWFEQDINWLTHKVPSESNISNAYDAVLLSKGVLLNSNIEFTKLITGSGDEDVLSLYNELKIKRLMLKKLYEKPIAERYLNTDSLEMAATALERELISRSKAYGDYTHNMAIGWNDVRSTLQPKDIAVEFVSFVGDYDDIDNKFMCAYIISPEMDCPKMIPIFTAKDLAAINAEDYYNTTDLSKCVWGKLDEYIKGVENIYFAPAGELYNIGIEWLPAYDGGGMMADKFKLYRLSSTRELAVIKDKNNINDAALFGGLKYDTDVKILEEDAQRYPQSLQRDFALYNLNDSLQLRNGISELPATRVEVENINKSLKPTKIKPRLYTEFDGTEGSFKELSGKKTSIMHIATHGFYWTESEARRSANLSFLMTGNDNAPRYVEDKAMTRSGLLFTGANNALMGKELPENINDGILTANEIAHLDLRGLDLVVLSACQTGLGDITGDGVFGLQRGFKKAGANTLLMSLWKVDDRATQMLMTKFYEHFLAGRSKLESLQLAQKYVREYEEDADGTEYSNMTASQTTKVRPFADPKYWAAFILLDALN